MGTEGALPAIYRATSRADAEQRLDAFLIAVEHAGLPAFDAFAKGVRSWRQELLAYFDEPTTNGYAEGVINKVKVIKRRAYGLPTFAGFRKRSSQPVDNRTTRRHPAQSTGTQISTGEGGQFLSGADSVPDTRESVGTSAPPATDRRDAPLIISGSKKSVGGTG